jgi:hypothetical protein
MSSGLYFRPLAQNEPLQFSYSGLKSLACIFDRSVLNGFPCGFALPLSRNKINHCEPRSGSALPSAWQGTLHQDWGRRKSFDSAVCCDNTRVGAGGANDVVLFSRAIACPIF